MIDLICRGASAAHPKMTPGLLEVPMTVIVRKAMKRVKRELGLTNLEVAGEVEIDNMASAGPELLGKAMAFKKPPAQVAIPESPDRLFRDLPRRKHPSLYDHQGQILRTYVAQAMKAPDVALQLPTGSGKTLVGLLLAEWRRRKNNERIVYLCPTRQLVNQVVAEASSKYGLTVEPFTGRVVNYTPEAKAAYQNADRVAVTTYSSLFNTNPFFVDPEVIIVDDAHASENYIASTWTVRISRFEEDDQSLFKAVAGVLKGVLNDTNYRRLTGDWNSVDDVTWVDKVPTPQLAAIADELHAAIAENIAKSEQRYPWRMIQSHLKACQVYVSSSEVLVRPLIPPTWDHAPFAGATQRIFMSATLGAGGDLERLTGRPNIIRLPIPDGWDRQGIGRRFFIFPEKALKEDEVGNLRVSPMGAAGRSLVLTPSNDGAELLTKEVEEYLGFPVFSGADLEDRKAEFVATSPAVAVVANRYDGIDFPDDDCRLLFVEGLPRATNLQERFLMNRMGANLLFNERVQTRVLQAVGRCTRGLNDYSAVVVTGEDLPAYLTDRKRRGYFHPELQAELEFGIEQSTRDPTTAVTADSLLENFRDIPRTRGCLGGSQSGDLGVARQGHTSCVPGHGRPLEGSGPRDRLAKSLVGRRLRQGFRCRAGGPGGPQ